MKKVQSNKRDKIVWILSPSEPLPYSKERELRSAKLSKHFAKKNFKVVWFTSNFNHQKKEFYKKKITNKNKYLKIVYLYSLGYKKNFSLKRLLDHLLVGFSFFFTSFFLKKPKVIISSYPPIETSFFALLVSKIRNIKHYLDYRDAWPETFYRSKSIKDRQYLKLPLYLYNKFGNLVLKFSNIITISNGFSKYLKKKTGKNISYFNLSDEKKKTFKKNILKIHGQEINSKNFNIIFLGNYSEQKFNFNLLASISNDLYNYNPKIMIYLFGDKKNLDPKYKGRIYKNIFFLSWINKKKINDLSSMANVGLAPYKNLWDFNLSIPNKIAEYLSADLPILSSLKGETEKFIKENKCGLNYKNNRKDLLRCIRYISKEKNFIFLKKNSIQTFSKLDDKYNIERMGKFLIN